MRNIGVRHKAQALRRKGESIFSIASKLSLPKSTVSMWCRDIVLTHTQIRALETKQRERSYYGSLRAAEKKRAQRLRDIEEQKTLGAKDIQQLSDRDLLLLGMGLYWGEGYKRGNSELGFTNSDPLMIKVFLRWLRTIYDIKPSQLVLRVSINALYSQKSEKAISYWSRVTGTARTQFTKTSLIQTRIKKFNPLDDRSYYGTLRVKVRRATQLHRRILGSLEHIAHSEQR